MGSLASLGDYGMMSSVNIKGNSSVRMNGQDRGLLPRFVLITPAHNEEALIKKTIESVISQTILPMRWVIVDDGSTDRTAEIVQGYSKISVDRNDPTSATSGPQFRGQGARV